jgi:hypothetical protein
MGREGGGLHRDWRWIRRETGAGLNGKRCQRTAVSEEEEEEEEVVWGETGIGDGWGMRWVTLLLS